MMILNNPLKIPTIIIHRGKQPYLRYGLEITSKTNEVVLIGDQELIEYSKISKNIHFVDIKKYESKNSILELKKNFKNYSTNNFEFEWRCFERIFIIQKFLKEYNLKKVFHLDSDAVLLVDINNFIFKKECGYVIPKIQDNFRMDASIHFGLINLNFCKQFEKLYKEIYISGTKFELIKEKINFHINQNLKGGVCDMTLYYLLKEINYLNPQNFIKEMQDIDGREYIFINNINLSEGFYGLKNFKMKNKFIKISNKSVEDVIQNKTIKLAGIHFQGTAKKKMNRYLKFKLN